MNKQEADLVIKEYKEEKVEQFNENLNVILEIEQLIFR